MNAIVLDLDPLQACDVRRMVERGLLTAGRITPRGAYVYELTREGEAVMSAIADHASGEPTVTARLEIAEACIEGECDHAEEAQSAKDESEGRRASLARLNELVITLANDCGKLKSVPACVREFLESAGKEFAE